MASTSDVVVRPATPEDSAVCGPICYEAFATINAAHGFPCDIPGPEAATGLLSMMFSTPGFYGVVAECDGRILGSKAGAAVVIELRPQTDGILMVSFAAPTARDTNPTLDQRWTSAYNRRMGR